MIQIGAKGTLKRLDEMLVSAMNGTFDESSYDETELSRLESRWKQYFTAQGQLVGQVKKERENIRTLVSDISHQTKTPLANILLYAELLDEKAENEEEKMLAGQIVRQTEKLQFLLQSLVKMSRLETGILELSPADGEIAPMIRETAALLQKRAEAKNICLDCELEERVICRFDRKWTSEALGNIIDNAVKYSPEESRITIRIRKYEFYACIEVEDQGPGIAEEERAQIFGRFYRGKQMRQEEGVGIGLYLAREILEKEEGYIKVSSADGTGSRFSIYLPISQESAGYPGSEI